MKNQEFKNRVFGLALIKSINSNFNADFTGQPRTLPDGRVYATDKALKYSVRHYLNQQYPSERVLYYKRLNENTNPLTLAELYDKVGLGEFEKDHTDKPKVLRGILSCVDVRLFGSTFAPKKGSKTVNLSVHGTTQINHGINQFFREGIPVNDTYSEQITAPFRSDKADGQEAEQTTIGRQSKLREGHYAYHFSINPKNLQGLVALVNDGKDNNKDLLDSDEKGEGLIGLNMNDVEKLKEGLRLGVSYFDSSSKAGSDNELLLWVQLNEGSKKVLPSLTEMVKVSRNKENKVEVDLTELSNLVKKYEEDIEKIELYYTPENTELEGKPDLANLQLKHLFTGEDL